MKLKTTFSIGLGISLAGFALLAASQRNGTSILHFIVEKEMANTGVATNAAGSVKLNLNQQGNADNQRLDLAVKNLDPSTAYVIWALIGDATNHVEATQFTTDDSGA